MLKTTNKAKPLFLRSIERPDKKIKIKIKKKKKMLATYSIHSKYAALVPPNT